MLQEGPLRETMWKTFRSTQTHFNNADYDAVVAIGLPKSARQGDYMLIKNEGMSWLQ